MSLSKQEIFNKVLARAAIPVESMRGSRFGDDVCAYRADDYPATPACFGGIFIPDHLYIHTLEGKGVLDEQVREVLVLANVLPSDGVEYGSPELSLLMACQNVHDEYAPKQWKRKLQEVAVAHELAFHWPAADEVLS